MDQHRWMVIGTARISTAQAWEWAEGPDAVTHAPLAVQVDHVVCAVCLQPSSEDIGPACAGPADDEQPLDHAWQMTLTGPIAEDEDAPFGSGLPQAVAVSCLLCGGAPGKAQSDCPERAVWARPAVGVPDDLAGLEPDVPRGGDPAA